MSAAAAARTEGQRFENERREPQSQVLHKLVREHLEPFLAYTREHYRKPLPKYVERELRGDGVYSRQQEATTRFHFVEPPSAQELASLLVTICERVCRMLRRRGLTGEASHDSNEVRLPEAALDGSRTVALSRGRFERLDDQGRAQQRLFADDEQGMRRKKDARWSADWRGFSLHAGESFGALDRRPHLELASSDRFRVATDRR